MNKINLVEKLESCEGINIYCSLTGEYVTFMGLNLNSNRPIIVKDNNGSIWYYPKEGYKFDDYPEGECQLWPSKNNKDWDTFTKPLEPNTPVMCKMDKSGTWELNYYAYKKENTNYVYQGQLKKDNNVGTTGAYKYIVPVNLFDFDNPNNSKQYSI